MSSWKMTIDRVAGAALGNRPTLDFTAAACDRVIRGKIPGDFVECGVFAGVHPAIMAYAAASEKPATRVVHLFDSFEGIPQAGPKDDETITGCVGPASDNPQLKTTGVSACSLAQVQKNMKGWGVPIDRLQYHEGWFQHTVPKARFQRGIAILRLDGDLYESTRVCLEYLHPLVPAGGIVIVDDYALTGCQRAVREYHAKHGLAPKIIPIEGGGGPAWYQK